jgi:hypothetical protein
MQKVAHPQSTATTSPILFQAPHQSCEKYRHYLRVAGLASKAKTSYPSQGGSFFFREFS